MATDVIQYLLTHGKTSHAMNLTKALHYEVK